MVKSIFSLCFSYITETINILLEYLFYDDLDVMSPEVKQILSNPRDAKTYIDAIDRIRSGEVEQITITYSKNKTITLIR